MFIECWSRRGGHVREAVASPSHNAGGVAPPSKRLREGLGTELTPLTWDKLVPKY